MEKITISMYGICFALSLISSFSVVYILLRKKGMAKNVTIYLILLNLATMLYGAKLYTVIVSGFTVSFLKSGIASLGGVIGLFVGIWIFTFLYQEHKKDIVMAYSVVIPLLYAVSKLGCHFAGCCFGIPYHGPFSIQYDNQILKTDGVFPVQMAESVTFFVIFTIGLYLYLKRRSDYTICVILFFCGLGKFLLAYLRAEQIGVLYSPNQMVCTVFMLIAIVLGIRQKRALE